MAFKYLDYTGLRHKWRIARYAKLLCALSKRVWTLVSRACAFRTRWHGLRRRRKVFRDLAEALPQRISHAFENLRTRCAKLVFGGSRDPRNQLAGLVVQGYHSRQQPLI